MRPPFSFLSPYEWASPASKPVIQRLPSPDSLPWAPDHSVFTTGCPLGFTNGIGPNWVFYSALPIIHVHTHTVLPPDSLLSPTILLSTLLLKPTFQKSSLLPCLTLTCNPSPCSIYSRLWSRPLWQPQSSSPLAYMSTIVSLALPPAVFQIILDIVAIVILENIHQIT